MVRIIKHKSCVYKLSLWKGVIQFLSKKKKKTGLSPGERFQNAFGFNNHISRENEWYHDIVHFLEISPTLVITHKEDSQELEIRSARCAIKVDVRINVFFERERERERELDLITRKI